MTQNRLWRNIHSRFKLNGSHYEFDELPEVGYSLIKEEEAFEPTIGDFLIDWATDNPKVAVQTSGSTGTPKTIFLKKEHMVNSAWATAEFFHLTAGMSALLCLPCSGIAGKMMLVRAMILGLELDYVEPSSTPLTATQKTYDFAAMVPLQAEKSLGQLAQIKTLIIGGAQISNNLKQKLQSVPSCVYETYGMTETITHIAVKPIQGAKSKIENSNSPTIEKSKDLNIQQSNFITLPGVTIFQDNRNCLVIDAPKISDEEIITNDMVALISETEFQWLGRYDSMINSGGVKLIPEQIEQKLASLITARFFVAGIPDRTLGQKLVLVIEGESQDTSELSQKIKSIEGLDRFEVPKEIVFAISFKQTSTGKVHKERTLKAILE